MRLPGRHGCHRPERTASDRSRMRPWTTLYPARDDRDGTRRQRRLQQGAPDLHRVRRHHAARRMRPAATPMFGHGDQRPRLAQGAHHRCWHHRWGAGWGTADPDQHHVTDACSRTEHVEPRSGNEAGTRRAVQWAGSRQIWRRARWTFRRGAASTRPERSSSAMAPTSARSASIPTGARKRHCAYFERKFTELAGQVTLLEQRAKRGAPAQDIAKAVAHLSETLVEPNAVGDLAALRARVEALGGTVSELTEKQSEEAKAAVAAAIAEREARRRPRSRRSPLRIPAKAQWKQVTASVEALFGSLAARCRPTARACRRRTATSSGSGSGPRARAIDGTPQRLLRGARLRAQGGTTGRSRALVDQAEALAAKGVDGIPAYRDLLDDVEGGRAGRQEGRRRAVGQVQGRPATCCTRRKAEVDARDNVEFEANLAVKLELLTEAEKLLTETDRVKAEGRAAADPGPLGQGRQGPREQVRVIEERLRKVEDGRSQAGRRPLGATNPERQERSEAFRGQAQRRRSRSSSGSSKRRRPPEIRRRSRPPGRPCDVQKSWLGAIRN